MLGLYFQIRLAELRLYPNSSGAFQSPALMKISLTKQLLQGILWVYLCGRTIRLNLCYVLLVFPHLLCCKCLVSSWLAALLSQRFKD